MLEARSGLPPPPLSAGSDESYARFLGDYFFVLRIMGENRTDDNFVILAGDKIGAVILYEVGSVQNSSSSHLPVENYNGDF